jgi:hypothetical protein
MEGRKRTKEAHMFPKQKVEFVWEIKKEELKNMKRSLIAKLK